MSVVIRPFVPADAPAVLAIERESYPNEPWTLARFEAFSTLVATQAGQVVGFACHSISHAPEDRDETLLLANLAVSPDRRRQGVARALLEAQLRLAARAQVRKALTIVGVSDTALRALHDQYGFVEGPTLTLYYEHRPEDGLVLTRALDPEAEPPWRDAPPDPARATVAERFAEVQRAVEGEEPERALALLDPLLRDEQAGVWARGWRIGVLDAVGRSNEAALELERLVAETGAPYLQQLLGERYLAAGLPETALVHLLAAIPVATGESNTRLWSSLGVAWERQDRFREAAWAYERLLREDQQNAWAYARLAYTSLRMGRPTRALELLDTGLKLDADLADLHKTRGLALWTLGSRQEARAALRRALELEPDSREVTSQLAALDAEVELPRY
jgi:tetratricopeptide (TPR) repeat protein